MQLNEMINPTYIAPKTPCAGLEPATPGLEVRCAIQLRQQGIYIFNYFLKGPAGI